VEMVPAAGGSDETRGAKEWSQATPLHPLKPDHGLRLLDSQLQTEITIETNVNVTLVNGKTASEVENLPVVSAVTENDLWDITTDANAKIVIRMTATAESVSNLFISLDFCLCPSFVPDRPCCFFVCSSFSSSLWRLSSPLEHRSYRTLNAPLAPFAGRHPHSTPKEKKGEEKKTCFHPYNLTSPHPRLFP